MDLTFIIGAAAVCLLIFFIFKSFSMLFKMVLNIISGGIVLYLFNIVAINFGLAIIINPITSFLVGFFGLPAVVVLIILKLLI